LKATANNWFSVASGASNPGQLSLISISAFAISTYAVAQLRFDLAQSGDAALGARRRHRLHELETSQFEDLVMRITLKIAR